MIFVTGVSGDLGRELARRSPEVTAGSILSGEAPAGVRGHRLDVRHATAVTGALIAERPRVVIHTAYRQDDDTVTREGAEVVARAAASVGARLVHLSSDVVFAGRVPGSRREEDVADAPAGYGRAKAEAETLVLAACPSALVVRTSLILGAPGEPLRHERVAIANEGVSFDDEHRSPIGVTDLADALLELAAGDASGPLHVGGADDVTRLELSQLVVAAHGGDPASVRGAPGPPERPKHCALDSSRARALLHRTRLRGARELLG